MTITVKLFATFRIGRFAAMKQEYPLGTPVANVIKDLGIQEEEIGMLMLNSKHIEPQYALQEGDNLAIFPLVGGG